MPRYLLLLHGDEPAEDRLTADDRRSIVEAHLTLVRELSAAGKLVASEALTHSRRAKVVRGGSVTDGPFAETKEVVGGFYRSSAPTTTRRLPGRSACRQARRSRSRCGRSRTSEHRAAASGAPGILRP